MWLRLDNRDRFKLVRHKFYIFAMMVGAIVIAFQITKVEFPTVESKISFGVGAIILGTIAIFAFFNRVKSLFKIKFVGFAIVFVIALLLKQAIDPLVWGTGLMIIPLAIDDLLIKNYWKLRMFKKYNVGGEEWKEVKELKQ